MDAQSFALPTTTESIERRGADGPRTLILAFAPPDAADCHALAALRCAYPASHVVAASACPPHNGRPLEGQVAVLALTLQRSDLHVASTQHPCPAIRAQEITSGMPDLASALLLTTCGKIKAVDLHLHLGDRWPSGAVLAGGVVGGEQWIRVGDEILRGASVLIGFEGVEMAVGLASGLAPGDIHVKAGEVGESTVGRFNGKRAFKGLIHALGVSAPPKHVPLAPDGVTDPTRLGAVMDLEEGKAHEPVAVSLEVDSGGHYRIWHAASALLLKATLQAAQEVRAAMPKPEALLVVACEGRRDYLKEDFRTEFRAATSPFTGVPTAGFCGYGESALVGDLPKALNWHCVIAGLRER